MPRRAGARPKALVFLDYDLLIRHFVLSGAFASLERHYEVKYVFHDDPEAAKKGIYLDVGTLGLANAAKLVVPRFRMGSWDKLYCITALHNQRGTDNFKGRREIMALVRGWKRVYWYQLLSLPGIFPFVRRKLLAEMGVYRPLQDFIAAEAPDIIIHPSILAGYFINELLVAAPKLGVPLVVLMNSWDNPSTKAMNTGLPTRLVVWGAQTKAHAVEYMKMPARDVVEFGAAQFEIYRQPVRESDAELRAMFGVPAGLPILLYGGASKGANETAHLEMLDAAIEEGRLPECHVLYRPHPWRGGLSEGETSFFDVRFRHVSMDPHMEGYYRRTAKESFHGFDLAEYAVTRKLLHLVSAVISPLSTILLESVMLGKPVLMFYPDIERGDGAGKQVDIALRLAHFRDFWGVPGIEICTDRDGLADSCRRLLVDHQAEEVRRGLVEHARKFVVLDGPSYADRLLELADELTGRLDAARAAAE